MHPIGRQLPRSSTMRRKRLTDGCSGREGRGGGGRSGCSSMTIDGIHYNCWSNVMIGAAPCYTTMSHRYSRVERTPVHGATVVSDQSWGYRSVRSIMGRNSCVFFPGFLAHCHVQSVYTRAIKVEVETRASIKTTIFDYLVWRPGCRW